MKYYKDPNTNELYAYAANGSQDAFIKAGLVAITETEADAVRLVKMKENFEALNYAKKRALEYPPITDYLDGIVKGDQVQIDKYINECLAVKAKYPKTQ